MSFRNCFISGQTMAIRAGGRTLFGLLGLCLSISFLTLQGPEAFAAATSQLQQAQTTSLPLDTYTQAMGAYSLRKLRSGYTGPAIRVRRSSDNVERDFGFSAAGGLDVPALRSFVGNSDGYVTAWYDQTQHGFDARQSNAADQPIIAVKGEVVMDEEGLPAIRFSRSAGHRLDVASAQLSLSNRNVTLVWVGKTDYVEYQVLFGLGAEESQLRLEVQANASNLKTTVGAGRSPNMVKDMGPHRMNWRGTWAATVRGTTVRSFHNGKSVSSFSHSQGEVVEKAFSIGNRPKSGTSNHALGGLISEILVLPALDSGIEQIAEEQNQYYNLYVQGSASALLPQQWKYQVDLYKWLQTLSRQDVEVPAQALVFNGLGQSAETLYRVYLALESAESLPRNLLLRLPASHFVLNDGAGGGFEGSGQVRLQRASQTGLLLGEAAWWVAFDLPGINPYFDHAGAKRRILAQAAVELMMLDQAHDMGRYRQSDFLGGAMVDLVYAYYVCRDVLPAQVQTAFEDGFARMVQNWDAWGAQDANSNMDTKSIAALAYLYRSTSNEQLRQHAQAVARKMMLGQGTPAHSEGDKTGVLFHSAGYVGEANGPETSYNGISIYYLAKAAGAVRGDAAWAWLWGEGGVIERMARFKAYQHFRDPDNLYEGPSGYALRTADSYVRDQSASYGRDALIAMLTDEGLSMLVEPRSPSPRAVAPSQVQMITRIQEVLAKMQVERVTQAAKVWSEDHWSERHGGIAYDGYVPGSYARFAGLAAENNSTLKVPFERTSTFNVTLGSTTQPPEFWAVKGSSGSRSWGALIESVSNAGDRYTTPTGQGFHGGGTIQSFWTPQTGIVLLMRSSKYNNDENDFRVIDQWPAHHLWGYTASGTPFTSALPRQNTVQYDNTDRPSALTVSNTFRLGTGSWSSNVAYERTIKRREDGLEITTMIKSDGVEQVRELWETIPVYLRHGRQASTYETRIEYHDGNGWKPLQATLTESVNKLRLCRDFNSSPACVYVVFDEQRHPQGVRVKLSSAEWRPNYQTDVRLRNIHVDLHGSPGNSTRMPTAAAVTYRITTAPSDASAPGEPPVTAQQQIALQKGWNLVSSTVAPADTRLSAMLSGVADQVVQVRDKAGRTYNPRGGQTELAAWNAGEGYMILAKQDVMLTVQGLPLGSSNLSLTMKKGWNLVPYRKTQTESVDTALASILSDVVLIKDEAGRMYYPERNINTIGLLAPGEAYWVYVKQDTNLTYP